MRTFNRIDKLFSQKRDVLSIFITAGYPNLDDTVPLLIELQNSGADLIEIGFPFSDPLADGPVIQKSSKRSLENGMSLKVLFQQLKDVRQDVSLPLLLMGYLNPVIQFGIEAFCLCCRDLGIDGAIIPDLPEEEYEKRWRACFEDCGVHLIPLVTPLSSAERIRAFDSRPRGFIYAVSAPGTTGAQSASEQSRICFFKRLKGMNLNNPVLAGFGIADRSSFESACRYLDGGIIGSAAVNAMGACDFPQQGLSGFLRQFSRERAGDCRRS